jgi:hypothetical protein
MTNNMAHEGCFEIHLPWGVIIEVLPHPAYGMLPCFVNVPLVSLVHSLTNVRQTDTLDTGDDAVLFHQHFIQPSSLPVCCRQQCVIPAMVLALLPVNIYQCCKSCLLEMLHRNFTAQQSPLSRKDLCFVAATTVRTKRWKRRMNGAG